MIKPVLALCALGLGGLLVYQWHDWPPSSNPVTTENSTESNVSSDVPQEPDPLARLAPLESLETYGIVIERPLFRPQRKPPEPEPEQSETEPEPEIAGTLDGMDLSAVVMTPAQTEAWVRDPREPKLKPLRVGDDLEGWAVKEILNDRVVLERQGERNELLLRDFAKAQMPAVPARPQAPARRSNPGSAKAPGSAQQQGTNQRVAPPRPPRQRPNAPRPFPQRPN